MNAPADKTGRLLPPRPEPGNQRAVTHGAFVESLVATEAETLVDQVYAEFGHLTGRDVYAVGDWAIAQVRVRKLAAYLDKNSDFDGKGRLRPAVEALRRYLERTERARARLGLDPASRLLLGVDESLALDRVRRMLAQGGIAAEARTAGDEPGEAGEQ